MRKTKKPKRKRCQNCLKRPPRLLGDLCPKCFGVATAIRQRWERICRIERQINETPMILRRVYRTWNGVKPRSDDE